MERPSRKTKAINYSDFNDDDEDFACVKAPPSKKPRDHVKDHERRKSKKSTSNSSQESDSRNPVHKSRALVDDKLYARDLEAALTLSMLQTTETPEEPSSDSDVIIVSARSSQTDVKIEPRRSDENTDLPPRLTNCSVDINLLGLNQITSEVMPRLTPCSPARQRTAAPKATEQHSSAPKDDDADYQPKGTPDSESEDDFSGEAESDDDDEFTFKKAKTTTKKVKATKKGNSEKTQVSKKDKQPTAKTSKAKQQSIVVRSPAAAKLAPVSRKSPSTPPIPKPPATPPVSRLVVSNSPSSAAGRIPKWNPPAQIGRSPSTSQSLSVKSPGQGLRLGLSRRVRVKPLHPSVAIH